MAMKWALLVLLLSVVLITSGCIGLLRIAANPAAAAELAGANMMQATVGGATESGLATLVSRDDTVASIDAILAEHGETMTDDARRSLESLREDMSRNEDYIGESGTVSQRAQASKRWQDISSHGPDPFDERQQIAMRRRWQQHGGFGVPIIYGIPTTMRIRHPRLSTEGFLPTDDRVFSSIPPNHAYVDNAVPQLPIMRTDGGMPRLHRHPTAGSR